MEEKDNKVKIYSYTKVWRTENKIYSIGNIVLPTPINPYDLLAFLGVELIMLILGMLLPFTASIPAMVRFLAIPYLVVGYLMKKKLDGKNPLRYLIGCIGYLLTVRGSFLQGFVKNPDKHGKITLKWRCSRGII